VNVVKRQFSNFQLYHGENKLIINDDEIRFALDQHV